MKSKRYSCRFALTALGAVFAIPALAGNPDKPIEYRDAGALPYSIVDTDRGNDMRDNRDSTVMRNDVGVLDVPGADGVDLDRGNDVRDNRDSTILRGEVPQNQTSTQHGG
jgi:hypothetical protein